MQDITIARDRRSGVSVIIPVYNSEQTLFGLASRLASVLSVCADQFEVIFINDGSRDHSWEVINHLADTYAWVYGLNLARNYGQHNALLCGIRAAQHAFIVTLDDDLQNPPEEIPKLLAALDQGYDMVYGTPQMIQHDLWRKLASRVTRLALKKAMGIQIASSVSPFRAFRTSARESFANYQNSYVSVDVLLSWGTACFTAIPVRHEARQVGVSNYTFSKLVVHALNMLTGFSVWPLRLASLIGFFFTFFGVGVLVYVVGRYLIQGDRVAGFPFLASVIAIFSGAQLFSLGIIGEYLARMHSKTMERPSYVIRDSRRGSSPKANGERKGA